MSAGSGASNLGYSNISPLSNINGAYVNVDSSQSPATFGSNEVPGLPGLAGTKSNIDAAAGRVPGICLFKGGAKKLKKKIKNITKQYKKMKTGSIKLKSLKQRIKSRMLSRNLSRSLAGGKRTKSLAGGKRTKSMAGGKRTRRHHHRQRGGYSQYQNNQPFSLSYSVGGILPASQLGLANPPPISSVTNNAVDNYNHYTNKGFPSKGH
jgi:hypothetical protein